MGANRFFGNEEIEWPGILAPHIESSVARMAAYEVVLCIQDTTELDFNGQEASGLGSLSLALGDRDVLSHAQEWLPH